MLESLWLLLSQLSFPAIFTVSLKGESEKYAKDVMDFLEKKSQKFALPDFRNAFETLKTKRTGLFVNERMLNFPKQIVPPSFNSLRFVYNLPYYPCLNAYLCSSWLSYRSDYEQLPKQFQRIVYVHKLRIADSEPGTTAAENGSDEPVKKKKKMGKAQKVSLLCCIRPFHCCFYIFRKNWPRKLYYQLKLFMTMWRMRH